MFASNLVEDSILDIVFAAVIVVVNGVGIAVFVFLLVFIFLMACLFFLTYLAAILATELSSKMTSYSLLEGKYSPIEPLYHLKFHLPLTLVPVVNISYDKFTNCWIIQFLGLRSRGEENRRTKKKLLVVSKAT